MKLCLAALGVAGIVQAQNPNPMDSIRKLPGYRSSADTTALITAKRVNALVPPRQRAGWLAYMARSKALFNRDTASMNAELRVAHVARMTRAPYAHDFQTSAKTPAAVLSYQAPNGGWSKHVDFSRTRRPGESYYGESDDWEWISTVDNNSTTDEIHYLEHLDRAQYATAIARGVAYLRALQMPNGCIPQVFPLEGSYHDAATFNDDATVNVLGIYREYAPTAFDAGVECILETQVHRGDALLAWGQQHDPLTLAPVPARSYELASISSLESAHVVDLLMSIAQPSPRVVRAVYGAAEWLQRVAFNGYEYANYRLTAKAGAGPLWGRLYEIGTDRVIMANRDGIKLYDWDKLTDRRSGYGWYTTAPAATLARFAEWSKHHARPT